MFLEKIILKEREEKRRKRQQSNPVDINELDDSGKNDSKLVNNEQSKLEKNKTDIHLVSNDENLSEK